MMWVYSQSRGTMSHGGKLVGTGYAGGNIPPHFDPTAKNNPERQFDHMYGPLPRGVYTIGPAHTDPQLGPVAMRLSPDPRNLMHGRDGFFIHGDSLAHPGEASEGCIVMDVGVRNIIAASTDRYLQVVE
jgi:hypothetical protein